MVCIQQCRGVRSMFESAFWLFPIEDRPESTSVAQIYSTNCESLAPARLKIGHPAVHTWTAGNMLSTYQALWELAGAELCRLVTGDGGRTSGKKYSPVLLLLLCGSESEIRLSLPTLLLDGHLHCGHIALDISQKQISAVRGISAS